MHTQSSQQLAVQPTRQFIYQLESGSREEQMRYERLIQKLDDEGVSSSRNVQIQRLYQNPLLAELPLLKLLAQGGRFTVTELWQGVAHLGYRRDTIAKSLRNMRDRRLIARTGKFKYTFLSDVATDDIETGVPIVYLPGTKSQKQGTIIGRKELKGRGEFPVAKLDSGETLFVSSDTVKVDTGTELEAQNEQWILDRIKSAKYRGINREVLIIEAFRSEIPKPGTILASLIKRKLVVCHAKSLWAAEYQINTFGSAHIELIALLAEREESGLCNTAAVSAEFNHIAITLGIPPQRCQYLYSAACKYFNVKGKLPLIEAARVRGLI
jgi:hypothetical protein